MNSEFPDEALKAQSVTARSFTIARLGKHHLLSPFDVCDDVHCQVFSGTTRRSSKTDNAVRSTSGEVLMYDNNICETFYHAVCGGHTEHNENVWLNGTPMRYLRGVFDLPASQVNVPEDWLINENNLGRWISEKQKVYCNVDLIQTPSYLEYTRKYFRWRVEYSQSEITKIIRDKTGHNVGSVQNIIPMERGVSGRLKKIRIIGSRKSITISSDLEIRKSLSPNYLYSSCFQVRTEGYSGGAPRRFIIEGAGWGHGIGMCQTGAAMMALTGSNYRSILQHYYRGASLKSVY
jgi:SpoIID/LytB domain protein